MSLRPKKIGACKSSPAMTSMRGHVELVINKKMNRGRRWARKDSLHMPIRITYLDRLGNRRTFSETGATKTWLFADKDTTILKVEVPQGGRAKTAKQLALYGWCS